MLVSAALIWYIGCFVVLLCGKLGCLYFADARWLPRFCGLLLLLWVLWVIACDFWVGDIVVCCCFYICAFVICVCLWFWLLCLIICCLVSCFFGCFDIVDCFMLFLSVVC